MKRIYLDHAATTYVDKKVLEAMMPYFNEDFGNPNSIYTSGRKAKDAIEKSRGTITEILNCGFDELIFTGSGTESDNLAIFGAVYKLQKLLGKQPQDLHIITSSVEHHAVLEPFLKLKKEKFDVTILAADKYGQITAEALKAAMKPNTIFVSIMYANNEIGTINPVKELASVCHEHKNEFKEPILFHTDACQAAGTLSIDTQELGVDLMTINAGKIYGPKGIGALFRKKTVRLEPQIIGGGQENNLRSGTENVPAIVGFAKALELAQANKDKENARLTHLRDKLINGVLTKIPRSFLNGHPVSRLPNNANFLILDIEGEALLLYLDELGVEVSTGSACNSRSLEPSHVLLATGLPKTAVHGSVRMTFGHCNTEKDVDYVLEHLPKIVENLRSISPVRIDEKVVTKRK